MADRLSPDARAVELRAALDHIVALSYADAPSWEAIRDEALGALADDDRLRALTPQQAASLAAADAIGRLLVTMIDGRLAIILPPTPVRDQAEALVRIVRALEAAGIGVDPAQEAL